MLFLILNTDAVKRKTPKRVHILNKTQGPSESGYWTRDRDGKRKEVFDRREGEKEAQATGRGMSCIIKPKTKCYHLFIKTKQNDNIITRTTIRWDL